MDTSPDGIERARSHLHEGERVERVLEINRDRVTVKREDRPSDATDPDRFYTIEGKGRAGLELLRNALAKHVTDQMKSDGVWDD